MLKKCDILIPIYNAPEWVKLCIYAIVKNTDLNIINKIYLLDDNSNNYTKNCLKNLKKKYSSLIEIITNKENVGFVKNCNQGIKLAMEDCKSDCILLLNTDCLVSQNAISKMMNHVNQNEKIGLICPISSNAANLTLEMFEGFNYNQMNSLLEKKFKGLTFDACTVVGNCLLITKKCIEKVGVLDESFGMGYGEETDYHFRCLNQGFEAKVAIDTYVYHKSEVSFGISKEKQERLNQNRKLFFERWGKEYNKCLKKYNKKNPIEYINTHLTDEDKKSKINMAFYLPEIHQNAGGCHVIIDLVNYMAMNGYNANIICHHIVEYKEIMIFKPINFKSVPKIEMKQIVATIWESVFLAYKMASQYHVPLTNFIQGYEEYFENGNIYGLVELSYKLSDNNLVISDYLQTKLEKYFNVKSKKITNCIHYDLINYENKIQKPKTFTFILRGSVMKGDFILLDIIKRMDQLYMKINLNVVYINPYITFPQTNNSNKNKITYIKGPLERTKIHELLQQSDVYIDASINEGFGLTALEAMTAGAIPIVSNSFGIKEYMKEGQNGFIIEEVNNADKYLEKIDELIKNEQLYLKLKENGKKTCKEFDFDKQIEKYIEYFSECETTKCKTKKLTKEELQLIEIKNTSSHENNTKKLIFVFNRFIPKKIKNKLKKIITVIYNSFQH